MIRPDVDTLYRYSAISERTLTTLRTGAFWFATPSSFNDPFDCRIAPAEDALQASVDHALERACAGTGRSPTALPADLCEATTRDAAAYARFREDLRRVIDQVGVLCLAEACDDLLMWAHYGASHRGVCIGLRRDPATTLGRITEPVRYRDDYPHLSAADFDPAVHARSLDHLWLTKAAAWRYEREWRAPQAEGDRLYHVDAPVVRVVFGARSDPADWRAVADAVRAGGHAPVFLHATPSPRRFVLELRPVQP